MCGFFMDKRIQTLVKHLELLPHPEGGFYKETYRSEGSIAKNALNGFKGDRNFSTAIYFLLTSENFSSLHRIKQDELWHFYEGSALNVHPIPPHGKHEVLEIGNQIENGEQYQAWVPAGAWFGATVKDQNSYSLVGCTVAPGFDFEDFELAKKEELLKLFPQHSEIISKLCRI